MTIEAILKKTQKELKRALRAELVKLGYKPKVRRGFLYAAGTVPVLLVAHLDTVHRQSVSIICYSRDGRVLMSPQGIGGDDRAGVYMVLQLLQTHRCHVLFCEDEECGGIGAREFVDSGIAPKVNYIVEMDRRGSEDAVFYDCDNPEFTEFVCSFGFVEDLGSFSDISVIAPHLGVAAVNISAGYYNEHTLHEFIDMNAVETNIAKLRQMLSTKVGRFEYIDRSFFGDYAFDICKLSPLKPGDYIVDRHGKLTEPDHELWMDDAGTPYEPIDGCGAAIRLGGCSVYTKENLPARFDEDAAEFFDILEDDCIGFY